MAINRGVLGSQTGSMGGITASNWKGRNVYKQKVPATSSSNSVLQQVQRRKFAALARVAGALGNAIRLGFKTSAATITEQNAFVKQNFFAVTDDGTTATLNAHQINVSIGKLGDALITACTQTGVGAPLHVTVANNSNGTTALPSDKLYICGWHSLYQQAFVFPTTATRATATDVVVTVPGFWTLANSTTYAFFKQASGPECSNSSNFYLVN